MSGAVTASVIGGTIAAGAGIAGSAIQAGAAGKAADTQAAAAQQAAEYQRQATQQALDYQKQQYGQSQQNLAPYMGAGTGALSNLSYLLGVGGPQQATNTPYQTGGSNTATQMNGYPQTAQTGNTSTQLYNPNGSQPINAQSNVQMAQPGANSFSLDGQAGMSAPISSGQIATGGSPQALAPSGSAPSAASPAGGYGSLLTPYQDFQAPTGLTMENDPGYQARLQLGTDALQRSAAARGNVLTGGTAKALDTYAQDYASNEYGNVYNRALQSYGANQGNYYTGQNNQYSRLMGLVSGGQNAATNLSGLGQSGANSIASTIMSGANAVNQQNNNAALATASGYQNQGDIWGNAVSGFGNNLGNLYALQNNKYGSNSPYSLPTFSSGVQTSPLNSYMYEPDYSKQYS